MELVFHSVKKIVVGPNPAVAAVESCFDTFTGRVGGRVGGRVDGWTVQE